MINWRKWKIHSIEYDYFPDQLKMISNCPKRLYFRGNWDDKIFKNSLSVVGSRHMTRYGKDVIDRFMPDLIANNIKIISGFMYGVDSEAHKKCIELGGLTVAVLGGGLNFLSPSENDNLYTEILETGGLVISEYEPDFKPTLWSFPQRNRIVVGLSSVGVMIIEAGVKSGSLITADIAKNEHRKVFAVPGPINSNTSEGTNWLIKNSLAKSVDNIEDIIINPKNRINYKQENIFKLDLSKIEADILEILSFECLSIDEISRNLKIPISELSATLSLMIIKNLITEVDNKFKGMVSNRK